MIIPNTQLPTARRVVQPNGGLEQQANSWPQALAAIERNGRVSFVNTAAKSLLLGLRLVNVNQAGQLTITAGRALERAITTKQQKFSARRAGEAAITLRLFHAEADSTVSTLLVIAEPEPNLTLATGLFDRYRLSVAEAAVLTGLLEGLALTEIAVRRRTSVNTIRSQLRSIFRKTATHRQAELVALFSTQSPACKTAADWQ